LKVDITRFEQEEVAAERLLKCVPFHTLQQIIFPKEMQLSEIHPKNMKFYHNFYKHTWIPGHQTYRIPGCYHNVKF
jgi:hypothetical protein